MQIYNTREPVASRAASVRASPSEVDRQTRSRRPSAIYAQPLLRGRAMTVSTSRPPRIWSVSPPRCAAEKPRRNIGHQDYRDVSPLGSPIRLRETNLREEVGEKNDLFRDAITDETARDISFPKAPKRANTRPDELFLPELNASELHRTDTPHSSQRCGVMELIGRGTTLIRAAVAFEQPTLHRRNAVRKRSLRLGNQESQPRAHPAQELDTIEVRLGLVGNR
jgi:hypothetical protein